MKISEFEITKLLGFFRAAAALEEFGGGAFNDQPEHVAENGYNEQAGKYAAVVFPPRLCQLGLTYLGKNEMSILFPITFRVKKLDLLYALLDTAAHCFLLQRCPNLEILEVKSQKLFSPSFFYASINLYLTGSLISVHSANT